MTDGREPWHQYYKTIFAIIELLYIYGKILVHCVRCSVSFQVDIFVLDGENLQMQTHLVPKLMLQNLAIILRHFNYGKNSFIVLVPVVRQSCFFPPMIL